MAQSDDVLEFWLGPEAERNQPAAEVSARWWKKDPTFDRSIESRFGEAMAAASKRQLQTWTATPRGRLAIVILLDQFTRNVYRGSGRMYDSDDYALATAIEGIDAGEDSLLHYAERYFLYMPLMHAENLAAQERCIALFEALAQKAPHFAGSVKFAKAHRDIVAEYGRFPHRNALLDRTSTPAELEFLMQPGSSF